MWLHSGSEVIEAHYLFGVDYDRPCFLMKQAVLTPQYLLTCPPLIRPASGLEVIEAHYLFGVDYDNIDIVIHPQSIVHSMVETHDSSVLAQV